MKNKVLLIISILLSTLNVSGQTNRVYVTKPAVGIGKMLRLYDNGTYNYATTHVDHTSRISGNYLQLGNVVILTSYENSPNDTLFKDCFYYHNGFTDIDFAKVKAWIWNGLHVTRLNCTSCSQLYNVHYFSFIPHVAKIRWRCIPDCAFQNDFM